MKPIILLFLSICYLSINAQSGVNYHVTSSTLNLRSGPSTADDVIIKLEKYDNLILLDDQLSKNWVKVKYKNKEGFVSKNYVKKGKAIVSLYTYRVGAVCRDGTSSTATGRGACSHHGGVARWKTRTKKTARIVDN